MRPTSSRARAWRGIIWSLISTPTSVGWISRSSELRPLFPNSCENPLRRTPFLAKVTLKGGPDRGHHQATVHADGRVDPLGRPYRGDEPRLLRLPGIRGSNRFPR